MKKAIILIIALLLILLARIPGTVQGGAHMIGVCHLLWIVPLSMSCGALCMAIIAGGNHDQ